MYDIFFMLKNPQEKALKDQKDYCFICGIDSDSFEEKVKKLNVVFIVIFSKGFYHHYKNEHNMYNYIYYILYLHDMNRKDHNAIEKYVFECVSTIYV